jgi:hypothetical protein
MKNKIIFLIISMILLNLVSSYNFCLNNNQGSGLDIVSITDKLRDNKESFKWYETQNIEIEVKVKNNLEYRESFIVELILLDENDNQVEVITDKDDLIDEETISSGKEYIFNYKFKLEDDILSGKYHLWVKYYVDGKESTFCKESKTDIQIGNVDRCSSKNNGIQINDLEDLKEDNNESWIWETGFNIGIDVWIKNTLETNDYKIELVFFDETNKEIEIAQDKDELIIEKLLTQNEENKLSFNFKLNSDIKDNYYGMYINVLGTNNCNSKETKSNGDNTYIHIVNTNIVKLNSLTGNNNVSSGDKVTYKIDLQNIGNKNLDDIKLNLYSNELKISETKIVTINSGGSGSVLFDVIIPYNYSGQAFFGCYATYNYVINNGYESTRNYYRDIKYSIYVNKVELKEEVPIITETNNTIIEENITINPINEQPILTKITEKKKHGIFYWIFFVIMIFFILDILYAIYYVLTNKEEDGKNTQV